MIRFTNIAVRLTIGSQPTIYASGYYPAAANMVRMVICLLVVGTLVAQCERAYRQRDMALSIIDHTLVSRDPDDAVRAALSNLKDLVQSRRVDFHTAYFFRLDYSFLVSVVSVMVTYTIILIQSLPK
uniref:Gustatory receptor GR2 n=1 Tax=Lobesia botrana TaxID=209534 RepID=A0A345BEZ5_9NEOP|nr:gustatory receptor GR2 [Lobesia botrana]